MRVSKRPKKERRYTWTRAVKWEGTLIQLPVPTVTSDSTDFKRVNQTQPVERLVCANCKDLADTCLFLKNIFIFMISTRHSLIT